MLTTSFSRHLFASREHRRLLDAAGALHFVRLDIEQLLGWIQTLGAWPEGMPATVDLERLGMSAQDLEAQQSEAERERAAKQLARRTLDVDGQALDVGDSLVSLRAALDHSLAANTGFVATSSRFTRLQAMPRRTTGGAGTGGAGGQNDTSSQLSDVQRTAIGFAGGWLTYQWLRQRHSALFDERCWVSAYRAVVFAGENIGRLSVLRTV